MKHLLSFIIFTIFNAAWEVPALDLLNDTTSAPPTSYEKNGTASNALTPFQPWTVGGLTISGSYDPTQILAAGVRFASDLIHEAGVDTIGHKRQSLRVPKNDKVEWSTLEQYVEFTWLMEGGRADLWTYGQVAQALNALSLSLHQHGQLDSHPLDLTISQNGQRKIHVSITIEKGEYIQINQDHDVSFDGYVFPDKPLPWSGIDSALAAAISFMQSQGLDVMVPPVFQKRFARQRVSMELYLLDDQQHPTYGKVVQFLRAMQAFYGEQSSRVQLSGALYYGGDPLGVFDVIAALAGEEGGGVGNVTKLIGGGGGSGSGSYDSDTNGTISSFVVR